MKLWVPPDSQFAKDTEWLMNTLESGFRQEFMIISAPNVLTPEVILRLLDIHEEVQRTRSPNNITFDDVCFKIPRVDGSWARMLERETENGTREMAGEDITMLCSVLESIKLGCFYQSILDLWDFNRKVIARLTEDQIIDRINNHHEMMFMGHLKNYTGLLSGIFRNESGHIISAKAVQNVWMTKVNFSAVDMDKVGNIAGTADWASEEALEWELKFEDVMINAKKNLPSNMSIYYSSART
ncbi:hypothetical protein WA026_019898 [Henosepilachna vigintioctopunctata]